MSRIASFALFLALCLAAPLAAHPVAQGRLELEVQADAVVLRFDVSAEEVITGTTFGTGAGPAKTTGEMWRSYGPYLLAHFKLRAGEQALTGQVISVKPPDRAGTDFTPAELESVRARYELRYPLPAGAASLRIEEDCLTEIPFAPGVTWTASYVLRVALPGQPPRDGLLLDSRKPLDFRWDAGAAKSTAPVVVSKAGIWADYFRHGFHHIISGWDHLLFVTALALAAASLWELVKVVTAFTVAHTLTLLLSVFDLVRLPASVVEPVIALSIVVVALQNALAPKTARGGLRLGVAFAFGLFHGLGFAGGLLEAMASLPAGALGHALAAFSVGVEAGHQVVVIPVFLVAAFLRRRATETTLTLPLRWGSALIAVGGCVYLVAALKA